MNLSEINRTASLVVEPSSISKIPVSEWIVRFAVFFPLNILYCVIIYVIVKKPNDFNSTYFTLIKALAVADFLEIIYDIHGFVYEWFGVYYLGEIFGKYFKLTALFFAWYVNGILHFFIGINRFCAIVYFQKYKQLFTKKITIGFVIFANLYGVGCSMVWVWYCGLDIKPSPTWSPMTNSMLNCHPVVGYTYYMLDVCVGFSVFLLVMILYVVCAFVSVKRLKSFTGSKATYIREIKMMCQGAVITVVFGVVLIFWYAPIPGLYYNAELVQTFYSCINAFVYLILDNKLQKHVYEVTFGKFKKSNQISSVLSTMHQQ